MMGLAFPLFEFAIAVTLPAGVLWLLRLLENRVTHLVLVPKALILGIISGINASVLA